MLYKESRENQSTDTSLFRDEPTLVDENDKNKKTIKFLNKKIDKQGFGGFGQAENIFDDPGVNDYSERWGSASVNSTRMFLLSLVFVTSGGAAWFSALSMWGNEKAQPILVEYNGITGEYKKPVRIENITSTQAMVKSALAKWAEYVFTVDPKLSLNYLRNADAMSKGRAKGQFADFRYETDVLRHLKDGKKLIFAKAESVDILQQGVAIVNLKTTELDQAGNVTEQVNYRVRLDYDLNPPTDEQIVLRNPIGLEIEVFTFERLMK